MAIIISDLILEKLSKKHKVTKVEIEQCFNNREGGLLVDNRDDHKTNPQTLWFVAPTNKNRLLKIMYVSDGSDIFLKSAYDATSDIIRIYEKYAH